MPGRVREDDLERSRSGHFHLPAQRPMPEMRPDGAPGEDEAGDPEAAGNGEKGESDKEAEMWWVVLLVFCLASAGVGFLVSTTAGPLWGVVAGFATLATLLLIVVLV